MTRIYVGIDGGLSGGISILNEDGTVLHALTMPTRLIGKGARREYDIQQIREVLVPYLEPEYNLLIMLEKAHPRPISGKTACFTNGFCYGLLQGFCMALNIPLEIISPHTWQKAILGDMARDNTKQASIHFCKKRFPTVSLLPTKRSTKESDGIADSLCIAVYCYRQNNKL